MKRSRAPFAVIWACLALAGLEGSLYATDVVWNDVTYHDASITSVSGDRVKIEATRDDGSATTFQMPISSVPDEIIRQYRVAHDPAGHAVADRPLTPKEQAAVKAELAQRKAKLAILKEALSKDPYHPIVVAGHILSKSDEGVVIVCDAATPGDVPQSEGTVFLEDCPGAQKLKVGDPIGTIGYSAGKHAYNFQNIQAFSTSRLKLENLKEVLSKDPYHPMILAGHIVVKTGEGVVIVCDAATPRDLPQSQGTVFLKDWPGAKKLKAGDPIATIGYSAGQHAYNSENIPAFSIISPANRKTPETPASSIGSTPASSP